MKILVVDDELVSRKKMQKILKSLGECEAAEDGRSAVDACRNAWDSSSPFELVILDILMPGMDGTEVLQALRKMEDERATPKDRRAKIFMATSQSDKETILACVQAGCDDFIAKPFNYDTVVGKVRRHGIAVQDHDNGMDLHGPASGQPEEEGENSGLLQEIISRFKRGDIILPTLPQIHSKFRDLVDAGANIQDIAEFLKSDAAITSKLISISNSSFYRGMVENRTLDQAINRLGLETTQQMVNAIANHELYTAKDRKYAGLMEHLWEHSLACAHAAQIVADTLRMSLREDPFTLGLLHDIGKLLLVQVVGEMEKKASKEVEAGELFQTLDAYHDKAGAVLLKRWSFPSVYVSVALKHHAVEEIDSFTGELDVIHFADALVKALGYGADNPDPIDLSSVPTAEKLGLDADVIAGIQKEVRKRMDELKKYIE